MTLVAAFQHDSVPILLGDFLISAPSDQFGTRKKIHLISTNLVVGWADDLWAAKPVLNDLSMRFHGSQVNRQELERFFKDYPTKDLGSLSVQIVGWLVDDEPLCFFWRSDYPLEIYYDQQHFVGSGAQTFKEMLSTRSFVGSNRELKGVEAAIFLSLMKSSSLIADEILFGLNRQQGFGFAFEIVYFDGLQFRFVDNILYSAADVFYDPISRQIHHRFYPVTVKYRSFNDFSVIQLNDLAEPRTQLFAVTPVFDNMPNLLRNIPGLDTSKNEVFPLISEYYCLFWRLQATDRVIANGVAVDPAKDSGHYIEVKKDAEGQQGLGINFDFIRQIYPSILNAGWDGSITSKQTISGPGKGIQFKIGQSDKDVTLGLGNEPTGAFTDLNHALWCRADGFVHAYESGVPVGKPMKYATDDVFSIDLITADDLQLVMYTQNRQPINLTQCRAKFPLLVRTLVKEGRSLIKEAKIRTMTTMEKPPDI
jgi:hypothetical protein